MDLMRIVQSQFISVFDGLPLENPFFPGENLNLLPEVQWWGMLFQPPAAATKLHHQTASLSSHVGSSPPHSSAGVPQPGGETHRVEDEGMIELDLSTKDKGKRTPNENIAIENE